MKAGSPGETRGQKPRQRGPQCQCCVGSTETAECLETRERQRGGSEELVGTRLWCPWARAGACAPSRGVSMLPESLRGRRVAIPGGASLGQALCDNSRGSGSPPPLMFKVLASPAFPLSTTEALKVAGKQVPDVGQGAASPQEGRQSPRHSAQQRLWSSARCPV